jgi:hypothetical protein
MQTNEIHSLADLWKRSKQSKQPRRRLSGAVDLQG